MSYRSCQVDETGFEICCFLRLEDSGGDHGGEMIDNQQDILSFSLDDVSMKVAMRLRNICFCLGDDGWLGLLLDDRASVTVIVQLVP